MDIASSLLLLPDPDTRDVCHIVPADDQAETAKLPGEKLARYSPEVSYNRTTASVDKGKLFSHCTRTISIDTGRRSYAVTF